MEKQLSTRVDETTMERIEMLARRLRLSKKKIIETAIDRFAADQTVNAPDDILDRTAGAWKRREQPETTVDRGRKAFRNSMQRYAR